MNKFYRIYFVPEGTDCKYGSGTFRFEWSLDDSIESKAYVMRDETSLEVIPEITSFGDFVNTFDKYADHVEEREAYMFTFKYKGMNVPVFCDDYGQCFYAYINGKEFSFGTYNTDIEDELKFLIDESLKNGNKQ